MRTMSAPEESDRLGKKRWRKYVFDVVDRLVAALECPMTLCSAAPETPKC